MAKYVNFRCAVEKIFPCGSHGNGQLKLFKNFSQEMKIDWCNSNENKKKSIYLVAMEIRLLFLLKNKFLLIFNDVSPAVCQSDEIFP